MTRCVARACDAVQRERDEQFLASYKHGLFALIATLVASLRSDLLTRA